MKLKLEESDRFDWILDRENPKNNTLKRIGAIDISYSKNNSQKAIAALIILDFPSMRVIYEDFERDTTDYPYVSGFLAFKEVPVYKILFDRLKAKRPELYP